MPVRFCANCSNLLYPRAPRGNGSLFYACRNCDYDTTAGGHNMVYRNELVADTTEKQGVTEDLEMDPTLPRSNMECPQCHSKSSVYFQDQSKRHITNMRLFYKCIQCKHVYKDARADESDVKNIERTRRAERIRDKLNKDKKKAPAPAPAPVVAAVPAEEAKPVVVPGEESDGDY